MKVDNVGSQSFLLESANVKKGKNARSNGNSFHGLVEESPVKEMEKSKKIVEMAGNMKEVQQVLEKDLTIENLEKYKQALRAFLDHYTKHEIEMAYYFIQDSRTFVEKKVGIIQEIDEKVGKLTEETLETNRGQLHVLHTIGEIQGLIVDLFV